MQILTLLSPKILKISYWVVTVIFALFMLMSGYFNAVQSPDALTLMRQLGYPDYFSTIIGVAKILGAIAILQWKFKTLKEWAYAGFTFDILGAVVSYVFIGQAIAGLFTLVFLAIMSASYLLWKLSENRPL